MHLPLRLLLPSVLLVLSFPVWSADALRETQSLIQEWVRTEQMISQENRQWQQEKAAIENIVTIVSAERRQLNEQIAQAQEVASRADEERAGLVEQLASYQEVSELIQGRIADHERQLVLITSYLPPILQNELAPRIARLESASQGVAPSLSERAQILLSLLSEINTFDSRMTLTSELIEQGGSSVEVQVLYFGLSRAFFINDNNTLAGYGVPAEGGWQWQVAEDMAPAVARAIHIHETRLSPQFIALPMEVEQ